MRKSLIRQQIEKILEKEFDFCFIDKRKTGVRIKLVTNHKGLLTPKKRKAILALPNVIKVSYTDITDSRCNGYFPGITIHLSCNTKEVISITLPKIKKGDKLIASKNRFIEASKEQYLTKNKIYIVKNVFGETFDIEADDKCVEHEFTFDFVQKNHVFINID